MLKIMKIIALLGLTTLILIGCPKNATEQSRDEPIAYIVYWMPNEATYFKLGTNQMPVTMPDNGSRFTITNVYEAHIPYYNNVVGKGQILYIHDHFVIQTNVMPVETGE